MLRIPVQGGFPIKFQRTDEWMLAPTLELTHRSPGCSPDLIAKLPILFPSNFGPSPGPAG